MSNTTLKVLISNNDIFEITNSVQNINFSIDGSKYCGIGVLIRSSVSKQVKQVVIERKGSRTLFGKKVDVYAIAKHSSAATDHSFDDMTSATVVSNLDCFIGQPSLGIIW